MKKFLIQAILFSTVVFIVVFAMDEITFSDAFISYKVKDTEYDKLAWNLHMINQRPQNIKGSSVVLGSSLVQGGINDSIAHLKGLKLYNFGVPHNGYDLNLYFVERLLPLQPKSILFLQEKNGYSGLHKLTPLVNRPSSLLKWGQKINFYFVNYLFKRAKLCLEYVVFRWKQNPDTLTGGFKDYGIVFDNKPFINDTQFSDGFLKKLQRRDEYLNLFQNKFLYGAESGGSNFFQSLKRTKRKLVRGLYVKNNLIQNNRSQQAILSHAKSDIESQGVLFAKVYVPVLSDVVEHAGYHRSFFFQEKGNEAHVLMLEDFGFLRDPSYWSDDAHVNELGAMKFSEKLFDTYFGSDYFSKLPE